MRRIGPLLALIALLLVTLTGSAQASPKHASDHKDGLSGPTTPAAEDEEQVVLSGSTEVTSTAGRGMNRMGGPSRHPGKGWKDPGQVQGTVRNTADPDCTGNRTSKPQPTNIASCDDAMGSADKSGGTGGFDADKDFNNGCGNDTDFEDDNNGHCGRRPLAVGGSNTPPKDPPKPEEPKKIVTRVLSSVTPRPAVVLSERVTAQRTSLPVTGVDANQLLFAGISLISVGRMIVRRAKGNRI